MAAPRKYSEELKERATRLALDARRDPASKVGAIKRIADQLGIHPEALRTWTGEYLKTGISIQPMSRYTRTFMQDKEMEILQSGSRREMLNLERFIVERDPGPLNRERWAGDLWWDVPKP